jgi:ferredoxin-NADP reductase
MNKIALEHPKKIYEFKIIGKELITHDTIKFVFELPSKNHISGVKSGQHVFFIANIKNNEVWRKYTPISLENETGTFEIVIKVKLINLNDLYSENLIKYFSLSDLQMYTNVS